MEFRWNLVAPRLIYIPSQFNMESDQGVVSIMTSNLPPQWEDRIQMASQTLSFWIVNFVLMDLCQMCGATFKWFHTKVLNKKRNGDSISKHMKNIWKVVEEFLMDSRQMCVVPTSLRSTHELLNVKHFLSHNAMRLQCIVLRFKYIVHCTLYIYKTLR